MMKKRTAAKLNNIDDLLATICRVDPNAEPSAPAALQPATMTDTVLLATIERVGQGSNETFAPRRVELRGNVLTIFPPEDDQKRKDAMQFNHVAFCSKVAPPPSSIYRNSSELRAIATKLTVHQHLAIYTTEMTCFWLRFEESSKDLTLWHQVRYRPAAEHLSSHHVNDIQSLSLRSFTNLPDGDACAPFAVLHPCAGNQGSSAKA